MSINSDNLFSSFKPSKNFEEDKQDKLDASPRPTTFRKSIPMGREQVRGIKGNPNATLSLTTNPFPQDLNEEKELFVNNAGESLPALKAQYNIIFCYFRL